MADTNTPITDAVVENIRKTFLAGVGAVATGAESATKLIDEFVKKGELTVAQGKDLNAELTQKVKETAGSAEDTVLKARLSVMSAEERAAYLKRAAELAAELDAEAAKKAAEKAVEVEAEVVEDEPEDKAE